MYRNYDERQAIIKREFTIAIDLFIEGARKHNLKITPRDNDSTLSRGFFLEDISGKLVLKVYPGPHYHNQPRLYAAGELLPVRRIRRNRTTEIWRGSGKALFAAVEPHLRPLTNVERAHAHKQAWLRNFTHPRNPYARPEYAVGRYDLMAALLMRRSRADDIGDALDVTRRAEAEFESNLNDELWSWLVDTSFTPALEAAKAADKGVTQ